MKTQKWERDYTPNWSGEVIQIVKVRSTVYHGHTLLVTSRVKKLMENFLKKWL